MDFMKFILDKSLILVPALYVIGLILKNSSVKDKYIPIILLLLGIAGAIAKIGLNIEAIVQGILVTGATVFTNQLIKQVNKEE